MKKILTSSLAVFGIITVAALNTQANTICINTGSEGIALDGINTDSSLLNRPGAVTANGDFSTEYTAQGAYSLVPFTTKLNPPASSPFTIEFWALPNTTDDDDAPVNNRIADGNRSGWAFFQRATGWNFRLYNGNGAEMGFNLTGGPAPLGAWSHVVATWDGTTAKLYVNGVDSNAPNQGAGGYAASTTAVFSIAALGDASSPYNGRVDEVAFYGSALSAQKIAAHYSNATSTVPGLYSDLVKADGAIAYFQQNPATISIADAGATKTVTFRGILSRSTDLAPESWEDIQVTSPYTVTIAPGTPKQFFRAHR